MKLGGGELIMSLMMSLITELLLDQAEVDAEVLAAVDKLQELRKKKKKGFKAVKQWFPTSRPPPGSVLSCSMHVH